MNPSPPTKLRGEAPADRAPQDESGPHKINQGSIGVGRTVAPQDEPGLCKPKPGVNNRLALTVTASLDSKSWPLASQQPQARIQGVGARARAHPWGEVSPFKMHYSIAFKHQSITGGNPLSAPEPRPWGGGVGAPPSFCLIFFPCSAHKVNAKISHSREHGAPLGPRCGTLTRRPLGLRATRWGGGGHMYFCPQILSRDIFATRRSRSAKPALNSVLKSARPVGGGSISTSTLSDPAPPLPHQNSKHVCTPRRPCIICILIF